VKERVLKELRLCVIILAVGILYYAFVTKTGLRIPCPFYETTGLLCPGCGITRMIISLSEFDFSAAYGYNKLLFTTWPLIALPFIYSEISYIKTGIRRFGRLSFLLWTELFLMIVFTVLRNI